MENKHLSNVELYYSVPGNFREDKVIIDGDDYNHIVKVMRHQAGDEIYITNGKGTIFSTEILSIDKKNITAQVKSAYLYENKFENIFFCIPKIKSPDRFEFALEKCVELGITNFIIFESERSFKKGERTSRWDKILLSAMKQSLLSYLPKLKIVPSLKEIINSNGLKIIFEQNAVQPFNKFILKKENNYYFIFGPEGGFTKDELLQFDEKNKYKLTANRLRSETAVITCASLIAMNY